MVDDYYERNKEIIKAKRRARHLLNKNKVNKARRKNPEFKREPFLEGETKEERDRRLNRIRNEKYRLKKKEFKNED